MLQLTIRAYLNGRCNLLAVQVYGSLVDDNDEPGAYIGGSFTPHDFSDAPEELVVLLDQHAPNVPGRSSSELCVTLDQVRRYRQSGHVRGACMAAQGSSAV